MRFFPTVVAASLSLGHKTGWWAKKVTDVAYVGNGSALNNLASTKVGVDIGSSLVMGTLIGEAVYYGITRA